MSLLSNIKAYFKSILGLYSQSGKAKENTKLVANPNSIASTQASVLDDDKIALHEAAHGIVWYLFRNCWELVSLSMSADKMPDDTYKGLLHLRLKCKPSFVKEYEFCAINYAGLIGQNIDKVIDDKTLADQVTWAADFNEFLNVEGCCSDFENAQKCITHFTEIICLPDYLFEKNLVVDLINIFKNSKIQSVLQELADCLKDSKSLSQDDVEQAISQSLAFPNIDWERIIAKLSYYEKIKILDEKNQP